jgi:hypothetical protein
MKRKRRDYIFVQTGSDRDEMHKHKATYTQCEAAMTLALSAIYDLGWNKALDNRERVSKAIDIAHGTLLRFVGGCDPNKLKLIAEGRD